MNRVRPCGSARASGLTPSVRPSFRQNESPARSGPGSSLSLRLPARMAGTSLWRMAGKSYLQYANQSAAVLRESLKEPVKSKVLSRSKVEFAGFKWAEGERGTRGASAV